MTETELDAIVTENVAQTVRDIMETHAITELGDVPGRSVLTVTKNREVVDLTDDVERAVYAFQPKRRRGTAQHQTLDSLIAWANRFKGGTSVLYADRTEGRVSLTAIANYHAEGAPGEHTAVEWLTAAPDAHVPSFWCETTARHGDHRGVYRFPLSEPWRLWSAIDGAPMDKQSLAEFIEDRALDILDPTPALTGGKTGDAAEWEKKLIEIAAKLQARFGTHRDLADIARAFKVHEASDIEVETDLTSGTGTIRFAETHRDARGKPLKVPNLFLIAVPVFEGGAVWRIPVRFRYRKSGADLKFTLSLHGARRAFDDAFDEACARAASETALPLFYGQPE